MSCRAKRGIPIITAILAGIGIPRFARNNSFGIYEMASSEGLIKVRSGVVVEGHGFTGCRKNFAIKQLQALKGLGFKCVRENSFAGKVVK